MIVGHKRLFYAIDKTDESRKGTRDIVMKFFIKSLGFTKEEIIFVDRNNFCKEGDKNSWVFN